MAWRLYAKEDIQIQEFVAQRKREDFTGRRVGMLKVVGYAGLRAGGADWWCVCDCGNAIRALSGNLRRHTRSCGCLRKTKPSRSRVEELRGLISIETDACVEWPTVTRIGYGSTVTIGGVRDRPHRWALLLTVGEPPPGRPEAAHGCGNRACVNPRHLRWASHAENMADTLKHGTRAMGERVGGSILTEADVRRARRASPSETAELARQLGVSYGAISDARAGRNWKHVK